MSIQPYIQIFLPAFPPPQTGRQPKQHQSFMFKQHIEEVEHKRKGAAAEAQHTHLPLSFNEILFENYINVLHTERRAHIT